MESVSLDKFLSWLDENNNFLLGCTVGFSGARVKKPLLAAQRKEKVGIGPN